MTVQYGLGFFIFSVVMGVINYQIHYDCEFDPEWCLKGKRVLVTGASSGIGEHVAYRYAELGTNLIITDQQDKQLLKVADKCKKLGAKNVDAVVADMAIAEEREKLVEKVHHYFGGLDYLILNHHELWGATPAENIAIIQDTLNVNFLSYIDLTSMLLKFLEKSHGAIGVVSSDVCKSGIAGQTHYCTSKYAILGFYSSLRQELDWRKAGVSVTVAVFDPLDLVSQPFHAVGNGSIAPGAQVLRRKVEDAAKAYVYGITTRMDQTDISRYAKFLIYLKGYISG